MNNVLNLNLTFVLEIFSFGLFIWIVYTYFWPRWIKMLDMRSEIIFQSLKDAELAAQALKDAQAQRDEMIRQASIQVNEMFKEANISTKKILDDTLSVIAELRQEKMKELELTLVQMTEQAHLNLQSEIGALAIEIAQKLLKEHRRDVECLSDSNLKNTLQRLQQQNLA